MSQTIADPSEDELDWVSWKYATKHMVQTTPRATTPNLPTNIVPTNSARLKLSGKSPMYLGNPPLRIKIVLESNSRKSTMLVGRLGVNIENYKQIIQSY